jgi:hypothetical protein
MALMAAHGEITPMPTVAIFADTQSEPAGVYEHLKWLMSPNVLPFPVEIVTIGNLEKQIGMERPIGRYLKVDIPAFAKAANGSVSMVTRGCTERFKIEPIRSAVRRHAGIYGKRSPTEPIVDQWIGISTDEASRMKDNREAWCHNRYPLIEMRMSRGDCLEWLKRHDYPLPGKSSCVFCPYHSNAEWRRLPPVEFARAVEVDRRLRDRAPEKYGAKGVLYLHRSCKPLDEVDMWTPEERDQGDLWGNECEGICGV